MPAWAKSDKATAVREELETLLLAADDQRGEMDQDQSETLGC